MLAKIIPAVNHPGNSLGRSPLNYTPKNPPESKQYQSFEDALTVCCVCNLPPEQAVTEFRDEFKKSPPPIYFQWWRNCWEEFEITPEMVTAWLVRVNRKGWIERLGGAV